MFGQWVFYDCSGSNWKKPQSLDQKGNCLLSPSQGLTGKEMAIFLFLLFLKVWGASRFLQSCKHLAFSLINSLLFLGSNALLISSWVSWCSPLSQRNVWNFHLVLKVLFVIMGLGTFMQQYSHGCSCTNCSAYGIGCLQRQWLCYSPVYLYTSNLHLMCN